MKIKPNDPLIIKDNDYYFFTQAMKKRKVKLAKDLHFTCDKFIGLDYGSSYEVLPDLTLKPISPSFDLAEEILGDEKEEENEGEDEEGEGEKGEEGEEGEEGKNKNKVEIGSNQFRTSDSNNQKLDMETLLRLKKEGLSGREIIKQLTQNSENFKGMNLIQKRKYILRKQKKYVHIVTFLIPNAYNICESYFNQLPKRIGGMRPDTLGTILLYGNIYSGKKVLMVDECGGMVLGSVIERLNGNGRIVSVHKYHPHNSDCMGKFNFTQEQLDLCTQSSMQAIMKETEFTNKGQLIGGKSFNVKTGKELKEEMDKKDFDSIIVASSSNDSTQYFESIYQYLKPGGSFVWYSDNTIDLVDQASRLRQIQVATRIDVIHFFLRFQKIRKNSTHPFMNMHGNGGAILIGMKTNSKEEIGHWNNYKDRDGKSVRIGGMKKRRISKNN